MQTFWYDRATNYDPEDLFWNIDWDGLNLEKLNSITVSEICGIIEKHIVRGLKLFLKSMPKKERTLTFAFGYCSPFETHTHPWVSWVEKILESKEELTNSEYLPMMNAREPSDHISLFDLMEETIQMSIYFLYSYVNATISYSQDNLEGSQDPSNNPLSSVYPEIKLDAIINIG